MANGDEAYAYWLSNISGIGNRGALRLTEIFGSARKLYEAGAAEWEKHLTPKQADKLRASSGWNLQGEYGKLRELDISFLSLENERYPQRLRQIPDAPYGLFYRGGLPEEDRLSVAVIGARECSEYGGFVARALGEELGKRGIQVISGMARGVDGISQEAALEAGGASYGVLGCGVDICYPASNRPLYDRLSRQGGLLSIYPPGALPQAGRFPARNRVVSGLADAVIVVEARRKSGTLITVDMALEQGRDVYAVPGRLTDRLSDGCNRLLQQGAGVILSPAVFLEEMERNFPQKLPFRTAGAAKEETAICEENSAGPSEKGLTAAERSVLSCLELTPLPADKILSRVQASKRPSRPATYAATVSTLMRLCLLGRARQAGCGYFCRAEGRNL